MAAAATATATPTTTTSVPAISATQGRSVFLRKHADGHKAGEDSQASHRRVQTPSSQTVVAALADDSGGEQEAPDLDEDDSADEAQEAAAVTALDATATASGPPPEGAGGEDAAVVGALAGGRSNAGPNANGRPGAGAEEDYAEILGAYYDDYLPIVAAGRTVSGERPAEPPAREAKDARRPPQRPQAQAPSATTSSYSSSSSASAHPPHHTLLALRSTYKSEPSMHTTKASPEALASEGGSDYSQMLENALFYSQAIQQIRENDTVDAGDPYAAAVPRTRPGKEDIRQRRARNVVASREVFSITTASTFIPLRSGGAGSSSNKAVGGVAGPRVMRSEPTFMAQAPARRVAGGKIVMQQPQTSSGNSNGNSSGGGSSSSSSSAVPLSRLRPKPGAGGGSAATSSSGGLAAEAHPPPDPEEADGWDAGRRAGCDQPLESSGGRDEGVKQRGVQSPHAAPGPAASPGAYNRLSAASLGSSSLSSARHMAGSLRRHNVGSRRQHHHHHPHLHASVLTAQSRRVAMRLLVRAGLSRIAIRVARLGSDDDSEGGGEEGAAGGSGSFDAQMAAEAAEAEVDAGVDLDPNGLQRLQAARRAQVERIDSFGFMHFPDGDAAGAEQAQAYAAWAARHPVRPSTSSSASRLLAHPDSEARWATLLASFDSTMLRSSRKIKQLVQAGMPAGVRARAYYLFSGAQVLERQGEYARLLALEAQPIFDVIERDVARSYPDHVLFAGAGSAGQQQLRRMLRAYAQYDRETGYCQGMGRLAGLLLIVGVPEEQAFWVLASLVRNYVPRYYAADLAGLRTHTAVFDRLLADRHPRLHAHLAAQGCDALMYATPWFMTLFTLSLPWATALRVWDWFVYRGSKVLFRVALAIMDLAAPYLLDACPTIAELLGFLLHLPADLVAPDALVAAAVRVRVDERRIVKLAQTVEREQQQQQQQKKQQ
ncbi:hypothetical protein LPJ53_002308 [Coemansia erecta]|uniref:Rab-GAP TBC domain-containing protein n=1 Tax=Coemansia erecta TaxID=147472 RepID=A0A9W7Y4K4_9FUNG|nr:hypothetical protein LPJ53_002308 [Coemansia erecta]